MNWSAIKLLELHDPGSTILWESTFSNWFNHLFGRDIKEDVLQADTARTTAVQRDNSDSVSLYTLFWQRNKHSSILFSSDWFKRIRRFLQYVTEERSNDDIRTPLRENRSDCRLFRASPEGTFMPSTSVGISSMIRRTFNKLSVINLKKWSFSNFFDSWNVLNIWFKAALKEKNEVEKNIRKI